MTTEEDSDRHRLLEGEADSNLVTKWLQSTQVETVDSFCDSRRIVRMSLLKIDTEGGDLDVLKGSERMLSEQRIDAVQVEAGMNPMNERHIPFEVLKRHLEERGYFLFGIYEQVPEWPSFEPHLRRSNPVFISKSLIKRNTL